MIWLNWTWTDGVRRRARQSSREIALAVLITVAAVVAIYAAVAGVIPGKDGDHPVASVSEND